MSQHTDARALLAHIAETQALADHLNRLHDLALYDSGNAPIEPEDKAALQAVRHLADLLSGTPPDSIKALL